VGAEPGERAQQFALEPDVSNFADVSDKPLQAAEFCNRGQEGAADAMCRDDSVEMLFQLVVSGSLPGCEVSLVNASSNAGSSDESDGISLQEIRECGCGPIEPETVPAAPKGELSAVPGRNSERGPDALGWDVVVREPGKRRRNMRDRRRGFRVPRQVFSPLLSSLRE
jgi:hypothetical protein